MSEKATSSDPLERFRELVTEWERSFDALANRFMGTDEFSRAMNQFQNMQLTLQKTFAELMAKNLAALNVPSREDVLRVGQAVHDVEMRLARVEQRLNEVSRAVGVHAPSPPRKRPARTRRPPSTKNE